MKNRVFMTKSAAERRRHLASVLKKRSGGALDGRMIALVLQNIPIRRQYHVVTFSDARVFQSAAAHIRAERFLRSAAHTLRGGKPVIVAVAPGQSAGAKKHQRAIYIYTPNLHTQRGENVWTKVSWRR